MSSSQKKFQISREIVFLGLLLILNATFLWYNAFRCFSFFDMSAHLDVVWRLTSGQKLYQDFVYPAGPIHPYLQVLFTKLLGFGKFAIWSHLVFIHSIVIACAFFMTFRRIPFWQMALVTFLMAAAFYWPVSFPWYDQSTHFFGIIILFILVTYPSFDTASKAFGLSVLCGIMTIFALLTKPNIGLCYSLVAFITLLYRDKFRMLSVMGFIFGCIAGFVGVMTTLSFPDFFEQTIKTYQKSTVSRYLALRHLDAWFRNFFWLPVLITGLCVFLRKGVKRLGRYYFLILLGVLFTAIISTATGSMVPTANFPLWGILMSLCFLVISQVGTDNGIYKESKDYRSLVQFLYVLTAIMCLLSIIKGFRLTGWRNTGENVIGNYAFQTGALKGWKCDRETGIATDQLTEYINKNIPKEDNLLILTALQHLYAVTNRESYKNIPYQWASVYFYLNENQMLKRAREQIVNNPPGWIIAHFETLPKTNTIWMVNHMIEHLNLTDFISKKYKPTFQAGPFTVMKKIT